MYDVLETDLSFEYLNKIAKIRDVLIIGGWAVHLYVNENYRRAFGIDYLKSRDIDIYIKLQDISSFIKEVKKLEFMPSSYFFRYELIYSRSKNRVIDEKEAKKQPIHDLVYVFLDLFTNKESEKAWGINIFNKATVININNINVVDINTLLELKCFSFFEREKLDKEFKDACDIYALLIYSEKKFKLSDIIRKSIEKIMKRRDLCEFIAENVLRDITKVNIVVFTLKNLL